MLNIFRLKFSRLEMKERGAEEDLIRRQLGKLKTHTQRTLGYIKVEFDSSQNEMYRVS